jgi:hypothetical protein
MHTGHLQKYEIPAICCSYRKITRRYFKIIKSRDTPHLAHFHHQAANFNLGSKKLQTVDLYRKIMMFQAFQHTHTRARARGSQMSFQHHCPPNPDVQEETVEYEKNFFLGRQPSQRYHFFHCLQIYM